MTSKERMELSMSGGKPDRVPVMCQLSLGHIYKHAEITPDEYWYSSEGLAEGYILSSACSVSPVVPPENIEILYEAVENKY
ncbi:MAG TPA: hypothetical protein DCZ94_16670 [Lentisphaeria bacterium]|nr:MAG: hypothetical protein A2X48_16860 [Lentisphaerae bacterium GWF2_49_21]HBC88582.1 hypothetical protein [Lentisphaeria bacterium]